MNHTPQRTRRKTTKRKQRRRKPLWGRFALLGAAVLLVLLLLRCGADEPQPGSAAADETAGETTAETQPVPATQAADPPSKDDPLLLLVSRAQPLAEDYAPELTQLHDWPYSIAAIAYEPLRQMLAAGRPRASRSRSPRPTAPRTARGSCLTRTSKPASARA